MRRPNFFVIGAPKCGTTSLATWLSEHPEVFFSAVKEPHYFNFDYGDRTFRTLDKYESLFCGVRNCHLAVGEGSVRYLYSRTAVPSILKYSPEAKFIVMLRNPVEMAHALHDQMVFNGEEKEVDFQEAWQAQSWRNYGADVPQNVDPQQLIYGNVCKVGEQLVRLYQHVPQTRVLLIDLDSIKADPRREYFRALEFLGLVDDGRSSFPVINSAKERVFPALWQATRWSNNLLRAFGMPHIRLGITAFMSERLRRERPRPRLGRRMRAELADYFTDDVRLVERLTGWDLTHWREVTEPESGQ